MMGFLDTFLLVLAITTAAAKTNDKSPAVNASEEYMIYDIVRNTTGLLRLAEKLVVQYSIDVLDVNMTNMKIAMPSGSDVTKLEEQLQEEHVAFTKASAPMVPKLSAKRRSNGRISFFDKFNRYDQIVSFLRRIVKTHPNDSELISLGKTHEGRDIWMLRIAPDLQVQPKVVFIQAGLHAREWAAPSTLCYLIQTIMDNFKRLRSVLFETELQLVPMANPDGYEHTFTTDRLWRKNRQPIGDSKCVGIDLNRNYDVEFAGSSDEPPAPPCSPTYKGPEPFSANETRALANHLRPLGERLRAFVDLHSYGTQMYYPFGYARHTFHNLHVHRAVAAAMASEIERVAGTKYEIGTAADLLYPSSGGSDDWAAKELNVPLVFTLELPDNDFELAEARIRPVGAETSAGLMELIRVVQRMRT